MSARFAKKRREEREEAVPPGRSESEVRAVERLRAEVRAAERIAEVEAVEDSCGGWGGGG